MTMSSSAVVAAVSMISFAIQQFLQFLDPFISRLKWLQDSATAANRKKALMGFLSFLLGLLVVILANKNLLLLKAATTSDLPGLDQIVSALVVGAGTETSNTVQKLLSYIKDKTKPA